MSLDIRDGFFCRIAETAMSDRHVIILSDDMDVFGLNELKKNRPNQFINVGVAEQNIINVAAGLSSCGKKVYVVGISSFLSFRCFEQIKVNICSMNLPVVIAGLGGGVSFSYDGPTHHGTHDLSIMRTLPEISIFNPSDHETAELCADITYKNKCPSYVRIDKIDYPNLSGSYQEGFRIIKDGKSTCVVSTGYMAQISNKALLNVTDVGLIDIYQIKPISDRFIDILCKYKNLIVVEDNAATGGIGSMVSDLVINNNLSCRVSKISFPDEQIMAYGTREYLHDIYKVNEEIILQNIMEKI